MHDPIVDTLIRYTRALSIALGYRDHPTQLHSERVGHLAAELGILCALKPREEGILRVAAGFHDVGKIGIPDSILTKASSLDASEWAKMKQHSAIGEEIIRATELEGSLQAADVIRHHHEHFDGRGYPDELAGEAIPLFSRITGIADSYDAMATPRIYHRARTHDEIMSILREETGSKHDPHLMDIFSSMIANSKFRTA